MSGTVIDPDSSLRQGDRIRDLHRRRRAVALREVPDETRQAARVAFEDFFKTHEGPEGVSLPAAL